MRPSILMWVLAALTGTPVLAQTSADAPLGRTIQCVDAGGRPAPRSCDVYDGRLGERERFCTCPMGGVRVEVAICAQDQQPPGESKALNVVRRKGARDGSLIGDTVNGQPICVKVDRDR